MNLIDIERHYPTQHSCIRLLYELAWNNSKPVCPKCNISFVFQIRNDVFDDKHQYKCGKCEKAYTVTTNTMFHYTKTPLVKWFTAIHIIKTSKRLPSCQNLADQLDVTLRVAQTMRPKIVKDLAAGEDSLAEKIYRYNKRYEPHWF